MSGQGRSMSSPAIVDAVDCQGRGLRVAFAWQRDRYAHRVQWHWGSESGGWLASREGAGERWPASPPLQQLTVEQRPNGRVALLMGMAGRSCWSMSVTPRPEERSLLFELACRVNEPPEWVGSRYEAAGPPDAGGAGTWRWSVEQRAELLLASDPPLTASCGSHPPSLELAPAAPRPPFPQTVRWTYRLRLDPLAAAAPGGERAGARAARRP